MPKNQKNAESSFNELCEIYSDNPEIIHSLNNINKLWTKAQYLNNINVKFKDMNIVPEKMDVEWDFKCILKDVKNKIPLKNAIILHLERIENKIKQLHYPLKDDEILDNERKISEFRKILVYTKNSDAKFINIGNSRSGTSNQQNLNHKKNESFDENSDTKIDFEIIKDDFTVIKYKNNKYIFSDSMACAVKILYENTLKGIPTTVEDLNKKLYKSKTSIYKYFIKTEKGKSITHPFYTNCIIKKEFKSYYIK